MEYSKPQTQMHSKYSKHTPTKGITCFYINEELSQRIKYPQIPSKSKVKTLNMKSNKHLSHSLEENILGTVLLTAGRTLHGMRKPKDTSKDE